MTKMRFSIIFALFIAVGIVLPGLCYAGGVSGKGTSHATVTMVWNQDTTVQDTEGVAAEGSSYTFQVTGAPGGSQYKWTVSPKTGGKWAHGDGFGSSSNTFTPYGSGTLSTSYSFTVTVYPPGEGGEGSPWSISGSETLNNPIVTFTAPDADAYIAKLAGGTFDPATSQVTVKVTNTFEVTV